MSKILILYGSTTGNTEQIAQQIANKIQDKNAELKNVADTSPEELKNYDFLILASSTWGDGQLQSDFADFIDRLTTNKENIFSGKKMAVLGLGDSSYPQFCEAANILEKKFTALGCQKVIETLKIDGFPDEEKNIAALKQWLDHLSAQL